MIKIQYKTDFQLIEDEIEWTPQIKSKLLEKNPGLKTDIHFLEFVIKNFYQTGDRHTKDYVERTFRSSKAAPT